MKRNTVLKRRKEQANKNDSGKEYRPELIAPEFINATAYILAFGARKYSAGNWARGMRWSRVYGALQRHLNAWNAGEEYDSETGKSHLWHACCCLMFLVAYEERQIGIDDRQEVGTMHVLRTRRTQRKRVQKKAA